MALPFAAQSFPEIYEQELVAPLFRPFAEYTMEALAPRRDERVLDVACGTGIVARLAKDRVGAAGRVVGVDLSPAMLAVARQVRPDIDWREADASTLPLKDGEQFDVVICQQGLQFVADKDAAVKEMRRALAPGGRLAVSTWRPEEESAFLHELRRIAERHVGAIHDRRHGGGDAEPIVTLLNASGFHDVQAIVLTRTVRFRDPLRFLRLNAMALVGMSAGAKELTDETRERAVETIVRDSADVAWPDADAHSASYELSTNFITARG